MGERFASRGFLSLKNPGCSAEARLSGLHPLSWRRSAGGASTDALHGRSVRAEARRCCPVRLSFLHPARRLSGSLLCRSSAGPTLVPPKWCGLPLKTVAPKRAPSSPFREPKLGVGSLPSQAEAHAGGASPSRCPNSKPLGRGRGPFLVLRTRQGDGSGRRKSWNLFPKRLWSRQRTFRRVRLSV
jgi:hypothetical protein